MRGSATRAGRDRRDSCYCCVHYARAYFRHCINTQPIWVAAYFPSNSTRVFAPAARSTRSTSGGVTPSCSAAVASSFEFTLRKS